MQFIINMETFSKTFVFSKETPHVLHNQDGNRSETPIIHGETPACTS